MDLLDLVHAVISAAKAFGSEYTRELIEIGGGLLGLMLVGLKIYRYGRDTLLKPLRRFMLGEEGFWDKPPRRNIAKHMREQRAGVPTLLVANFKGGVGKSTTAANLAAFYDSFGIRTLLIDLDYQGSLTDSLVKTGDDLKFAAVSAISGETSPADVFARAEVPIPSFSHCKVLCAYYTLNREENRILFRWLVGETRSDIRYNLTKLTTSREAKRDFDLIIIDGAPRVMTATVNAICASTHVLVPTILDDLSASATINTLEFILNLRDKIAPGLKIIGVLPTFVHQRNGLLVREQRALNYLNESIAEKFADRQQPLFGVLSECGIRRKEAIAKAAGETVAFFNDADVADMYTSLGIEVSRHLGDEFARKLTNDGTGPAGTSRTAKNNVVQLGLQGV